MRLWLSLVALCWISGCQESEPISGITLMDGGTAGSDTSVDAPTWTNFAKPFFESYCVGCHAAFRNYTTREHVTRDAYFIRCGVSPEPLALCPVDIPLPRQYPYGEGPAPDDGERRRMVEWFDDGMP
ncbi:MAG: hypothetical protein GXP55_03040 [Deltaproteobacteria bacterium]|nr:hypothetical protein [Deltaproteobacteria bacterium]